MRHECQGWDCPEFADARRDAEALVRCVIAGDLAGIHVIAAVLREDARHAADVSLLLAEMAAGAIRRAAAGLAWRRPAGFIPIRAGLLPAGRVQMQKPPPLLACQ